MDKDFSNEALVNDTWENTNHVEEWQAEWECLKRDNRKLEYLETDILRHKAQVAASMLAMGDMLTEVKEIVGHGNFLKFLSNNVGIGERTARNYMRAAAAFPESKRQTISVLTSSQVLMLAELPENTRDDFIENTTVPKIAEMSTRELKAAVKAEKNGQDTTEEILSHFAKDTEDSYTEYEIELDKLKPFPLYDYYIKDTLGIRTGKDYIKLLSVMEKHPNYFADPIFITKDNIILDGHERIRAAKDLGWKTIKVRYAACWAPVQDTYENTLLAVFLDLQSWGYTRTSTFIYFTALYYEAIGEHKQAEVEWQMLKDKGAEIDRIYHEHMKAAYKYLEERQKKGEELTPEECKKIADDIFNSEVYTDAETED